MDEKKNEKCKNKKEKGERKTEKLHEVEQCKGKRDEGLKRRLKSFKEIIEKSDEIISEISLMKEILSAPTKSFVILPVYSYDIPTDPILVSPISASPFPYGSIPSPENLSQATPSNPPSTSISAHKCHSNPLPANSSLLATPSAILSQSYTPLSFQSSTSFKSNTFSDTIGILNTLSDLSESKEDIPEQRLSYISDIKPISDTNNRSSFVSNSSLSYRSIDNTLIFENIPEELTTSEDKSSNSRLDVCSLIQTEEIYYKKNNFDKELELEKEENCVYEFFLRYETKFGERIVMVGDCEELGDWNPEKGVYFEWNLDHIWSGRVEVRKVPFEYKYVCVSSERVLWERGENHKFVEEIERVFDCWQTK